MCVQVPFKYKIFYLFFYFFILQIERQMDVAHYKRGQIFFFIKKNIQGVPEKTLRQLFLHYTPKNYPIWEFFSPNHMPIVPSFCWYQYYFSETSGLFRISNVSGKSQISVFPRFGHIQISPKKSSDNVMSDFLNRFSICFLLQHSDWYHH